MLAVAIASLGSLACGDGGRQRVEALADAGPAGVAGGRGRDGSTLPPPPEPALTLTGVVPPAGPFGGGNAVVLRGSALTDDAEVYFADVRVQPADVVLLDDNSLQVIAPAGRPGPADVRVVAAGDEAVRIAGYTYNALSLQPPSGSAAGGTLVELQTAEPALEGEVQVDIGGAACEGVELASPSLLRCRTPPGAVGLADVELHVGDATPLRAEAAYEYVDPSDTFTGGVSGGRFAGTLDLTLVDTDLGVPTPAAEVLLVDANGQRVQGTTNAQGQLTLSDPSLRAPVSVHSFRDCFESQSLLDFDAAHLTLYTRVSGETRCEQQYCEALGGSPKCCDPDTYDPDECDGPPPDGAGGGGGGGNGHGVLGSLISGELLFPGPEEFGANAWDNIPRPLEGELRVAYIQVTRSSIFGSSIPPNQPGVMARVEERDVAFGDRGYPYSALSRSGGLAVYALAGLEDTATGRFVPYVMGVTGDVLTSPGQDTTGIDIRMDIPLDQVLRVSLENLPAASARAPSELRMEAHLDLGGEGVILREVEGAFFDSVTKYSADGLFEFYAQPPLVGPLADARYVVYAGWYSGAYGVPPYTELIRTGVERTAAPTVLDDLLAIAGQSSPIRGGRIPDDRLLRWVAEGAEPDMWMAYLAGDGGTRLWRILMSGARRELPLPRVDLLPEGLLTWRMRGVRIAGFDYDRFNYDYLSSRLWTHESYDELQLQR